MANWWERQEAWLKAHHCAVQKTCRTCKHFEADYESGGDCHHPSAPHDDDGTPRADVYDHTRCDLWAPNALMGREDGNE